MIFQNRRLIQSRHTNALRQNNGFFIMPLGGYCLFQYFNYEWPPLLQNIAVVRILFKTKKTGALKTELSTITLFQ